MSLVRLLPAWFHAIADYAVGAGLIVIALAVGGERQGRRGRCRRRRHGARVSMLTKYPLGVAKVLPFTVHSAGDYLAAALLLVAPFALNFHNSDTGLTAVYIVAGIAVLAREPRHELPVQREARVERQGSRRRLTISSRNRTQSDDAPARYRAGASSRARVGSLKNVPITLLVK